LRREYVFELRLRGASFREIAEGVHARGSRGWELPKGYDRRHVHLDLQRYLEQKGRMHGRQVRLQIAINVERYGLLLKQVWPGAMRGNARSIDQARKLIKEISELERMGHAVEGEAGIDGGDIGGGEEEGEIG